MLLELCLTCAALLGCGDDAGDDPPPKPGETVIKFPKPEGVEWEQLGASALRFVGIMHAFRLATEPGTRAGGFGLGNGYTDSVANLHGWADGDPFYVNYVGHPMQGSVSGRLWMLHDPKYRGAEFGRSSKYWKGRLRGTAFAWGLSEMFEIGPLSEASIGHIQKDFPQQGFVDHVVTPVVGLGWTIAEDAIDRYLVKRIEGSTQNRYARIFARAFLNPAHSFANLVDWKAPWYRDSRPGVLAYRPGSEAVVKERPEPVKEVAPFEFVATAGVRQLAGERCVGGGAEAAWRVATEWQLVAAVNGCKMTGMRENVSGDGLFYQVGPRWTPAPTGRWSPYAHLLVGGMKVTQETMNPAEKATVLEAAKELDPSLDYQLHGKYTTQREGNGLALTAGMGVDYRVGPALAIRVANLEYLRAKAGTVGSGGFQMSTGMVLRWGTW
jgi:hypothetical protein